ncbi:MAG: hypothetical protein AAF249_09145 [Pseudomonadota bacterium]
MKERVRKRASGDFGVPLAFFFAKTGLITVKALLASGGQLT